MLTSVKRQKRIGTWSGLACSMTAIDQSEISVCGESAMDC